MDIGHPICDSDLDRMRHDQRRLLLAIEQSIHLTELPPLKAAPGLKPLIELGLREYADGLADEFTNGNLERAFLAPCAKAALSAVRATVADVRPSAIAESH